LAVTAHRGAYPSVHLHHEVLEKQLRGNDRVENEKYRAIMADTTAKLVIE